MHLRTDYQFLFGNVTLTLLASRFFISLIIPCPNVVHVYRWQSLNVIALNWIHMAEVQQFKAIQSHRHFSADKLEKMLNYRNP